MLKRTFLLMLVVLLNATALTACNTMEGFGQDLQKVGDEIEDAADK